MFCFFLILEKRSIVTLLDITNRRFPWGRVSQFLKTMMFLTSAMNNAPKSKSAKIIQIFQGDYIL